MRRHVIAAVLAAALLAGCQKRDRRIPQGYPTSYGATLRQADQEKKLVIWSAVDRAKAVPLLNAFHQSHPGIALTYVELSARALNDGLLAAVARHRGVPDLLWSSAMDLQIKLTNDGYAQPYMSPERRHVPDWANWKDQAWGTTAEPVVMIYNRTLVPDAVAPRTRAALTALLEQMKPELAGRIATYDVPNSAVGYLYLMQDQQATRDIWRLVRAMGANHVKLFDNAEQIVTAVRRGDAAIGYNIIGSYARDEMRRDRNLGMVLPRDYTLVMSRIALIPTSAPHPAAAKIFLDYLLSRTGQQLLVTRSMTSVRADIAHPEGLDATGVPLRAIRVGPALLVGRDQLTRRYFLKRWYSALSAAMPDER